MVVKVMRAAIFVATLAATATAFSPAANSRASTSLLFRSRARLPTSTQLNAAAAAVPNPFKKLPWNAQKEREREARRMRQERAKLHRELGIPEDATFEEITAATELLIRKSEGDVKKKIKIEMAKDRIMQIRLNERLAGLATQTKEARAASALEEDDTDLEPDEPRKKVEWSAPRWAQGIIVKPDEKWRNRQITVWGTMTAIGFLLPPLVEKLEYINWLLAVGQMALRGVPDDGGEYQMISGKRARPHNKVAWFIGMSIWLTMKVFTALLVRRLGIVEYQWSDGFQLALSNLVLGIATAYLQPYKG